MVEKYFTREYLPGYTGHIPKKMESFGVTAGEINRKLVLRQVAVNEKRINIRRKNLYTPDNKMAQRNKSLDHIKYGFKSRNGVNWMGGPTDNLYEQHIPGYQGHVPGINSENIFGKSYARTTKTAVGPHLRKKVLPLVSMQQYFYNPKNNRRFYDNKSVVKYDRDEKSFNEYGGMPQKAIHKRSESLPFTQTLRIKSDKLKGGGLESLFPKPKTTLGDQVGEGSYCNFASTKSKWTNVPVQDTLEFRAISPTFQSILLKGKKTPTLPVVGYKGFQPGCKSQNFFGRGFRVCSVQSKNLQILTSSPSK